MSCPQCDEWEAGWASLQQELATVQAQLATERQGALAREEARALIARMWREYQEDGKFSQEVAAAGISGGCLPQMDDEMEFTELLIRHGYVWALECLQSAALADASLDREQAKGGRAPILESLSAQCIAHADRLKDAEP